tara:strand:- start:443 stop:829 length:387 start_codon:yes stop_codon:yes gene_type:complete
MQHEPEEEPLPPLDPHGLHMIAAAMQSTRPETAKFLRLQARAMQEHMENLAGVGGILSGMARPHTLQQVDVRAAVLCEINGSGKKRPMDEAMPKDRVVFESPNDDNGLALPEIWPASVLSGTACFNRN